ncbi:MAG TPA: hypothetical protein VGM90_05805 [Kofleriaceae bacterium]|jgi:hypothetical protein
MKITLAFALLLAACGSNGSDNSPVEDHRVSSSGCSPGDSATMDDCLADTDCASDEACICDLPDGHSPGTHNICAQSGCRVDADCGADGLCSPDVGGCSNGPVTDYQCRTKNDECGTDADCGESDGTAGACAFLPEVEHWGCVFQVCAG